MGGIILKHGGAVDNTTTTAGDYYGVEIYGGKGTVTNTGSISSTAQNGRGVELLNGGIVTNLTAGSITAVANGIYIRGGSGDVTNDGAISASGQFARGVQLDDGGSIINQKKGVITGYKYAVQIYGASGTVTNAGTIMGTHRNGVGLDGGGVVINQLGGTISAVGNAVDIDSVPGKVTNANKITGGSTGVGLFEGGSIFNYAGGTIEGGVVGIDMGLNNAIYHDHGGGTLKNMAGGKIIGGYTGVVAGGTSTAIVTNAGAIVGKKEVIFSAGSVTATLGDGMEFLAGGSVTNQSGGSITGARYGVYVSGASGSVTNAGKITGVKGSVIFEGTGANTLTLRTGSELIGVAKGSTASGATNAVILQGTGVAANAFEDFDTLTVDANAAWTLKGAAAIGATTVVGTLKVSKAGSLSGDVTIKGGVAIFKDSFAGGVTFAGLGELELGQAYDGNISGLANGDKIDFLNHIYAATDKLALANNLLTVETSSATAVVAVHLTGSQALTDFRLGHDAAGHILVADK